MAKSRVVRLLTQEGKDPEATVVEMVNSFGQVETARRLKVSQATISRLLKEFGYQPRIVFVKQEQSA